MIEIQLFNYYNLNEFIIINLHSFSSHSTANLSACGRHTMGNEKSLPDRCNSAQTSYLNHHNLQKNRHHPAANYRHSTPSTHFNPTAEDHHPSSSYSSYNSSRPPSRAPSTTKSYASSSAYSTASAATQSTTISNRTSYHHQPTQPPSTSVAESKQTKYLKEQLYIKSYLDIVEQDRNAQSHFKAAKPGIRNYTPKILVQAPPKKELDVWI